MQSHWLERNSSAFFHNIYSLKQVIKGANLGVVIKANAYGHGLLEIAQYAQQSAEVDWLFVAKASEALFLRRQGITKHILVLGIYDAPWEELIIHNIASTVHELYLVQPLIQAAQKIGKRALIHLKIDTGLSRLGIRPEYIEEFLKVFSCAIPWLEIQGLFTHLADTNNADPSYTYQQLDAFERVRTIITQEIATIIYTHALASGSLWLHHLYPYSLVRVGTCAYGMWKSELNKQRLRIINSTLHLKPVLSWKSYIESFCFFKGKRYAIVPVGFADGYPRALAGKSWVGINYERAPIVSIDAHEMLIDVSKISLIQKDQEVLLLADKDGLRAEDLARAAHMLPHELTTTLKSQEN